MAKVRKNIVISGLSGSLGDQFVIQTGKGGQTIIRTKPRPSDQLPSAAQVEVRQRFQEATAYAKQAKEAPVYVEKASGTPKTPYNVAGADWFHPPEVAEVDPSITLRQAQGNTQGMPGQLVGRSGREAAGARAR